MKNWKKLYLSLCRRKANFLIFLVLAGLSLLFLSIFMIYQSADHAIEEIKKSYGSSFKLRVVKDESKPEFFKEVEASGRVYQFYCGPNVNFEMLERVQDEVEDITEYNAGRPNFVLLLDYQLIEGFFYYDYIEQVAHPSSGYMYTAEETKNLMYKTLARVACNSQHEKNFQNGSFALTEGRHIKQDDAYKVIISEKLAEKNHLKVGDPFRIETSSLNIGVDYPIYSLGGVDTEIVGLYQLTYEQSVSSMTLEEDILENWIVVDRKTGEVLDELYGEPDQLEIGRFYVEHPDEVEKVMEKVRALDWIDWRYFEVCEDDSQYSDAIKPLTNMKLILFWTVIILGILTLVLISLLMTHNAKKRRREWGIFLAMGVPVKEIRSLVKKEYLFITLTAFLAAFITCMLLTPVLGNGIYKGMGGGNEVKEYTEEEINAAIARGEHGLAQQMSQDQHLLQDHILPEELEIQFNFLTALVVAGAELAAVMFFISEALDSTLSRKPMDVLTMIR